MPRIRHSLFVSGVVLALAACGSGTDTTNGGSSPVNGKTFVLNEWSVTGPTDNLHAGRMELTVSNHGRETHELVIVRAADVASLPTKPDGSVDEDKIPEADKVGEIGDLEAGKSGTKTFDLAAGGYVAFCNLIDQMGAGNGGMGSDGMGGNGMGGNGMGHVHYSLGMVTAFTVT